ncbi:hypothetical protein [Flavobacterium sp.]|uniref:hypothetical protein n=1 Tax=Flavobacterium sp. TaxID=239 RepID=UPI003D0F5C53
MKKEFKIHLVSFDNPFPPVYGGIIDVYFKICALKRIGVKVYLHCFVDVIPKECEVLGNLVEELHFYKKKKYPWLLFSKFPLSVAIRSSEELLNRLNQNDFPILFESLKTTAVLTDKRLLNTNCFLRLHNLEDNYFRGIALQETNWIKRILFKLEAFKYERYKAVFEKNKEIFTISNFENSILTASGFNSRLIPAFSGNLEIKSKNGLGTYCLYHGDLRTSDNQQAVNFLLDLFENKINRSLKIASSTIPTVLLNRINALDHVEYVKVSSNEHLESLVIEAQVHLLFSFQNSGTKLKIINALFKGRHIICNENMIDDEKALALCHLYNGSESDLIDMINRLFELPYQSSPQRNSYLLEMYNDIITAQKLKIAIFGE